MFSRLQTGPFWVSLHHNTSSADGGTAVVCCVQVDELFDSNTELEEENTRLVGRAERAEAQTAELKEQLEAALAQVSPQTLQYNPPPPFPPLPPPSPHICM